MVHMNYSRGDDFHVPMKYFLCFRYLEKIFFDFPLATENNEKALVDSFFFGELNGWGRRIFESVSWIGIQKS